MDGREYIIKFALSKKIIHTTMRLSFKYLFIIDQSGHAHAQLFGDYHNGSESHSDPYIYVF